jgi:hypothetical protein
LAATGASVSCFWIAMRAPLTICRSMIGKTGPAS